jgi:hypothetical protein
LITVILHSNEFFYINGSILEDVKHKRNHLAHGNQTFHDIGKSATYNDLNKQKESIFEYLEKVVEQIEPIFLDNVLIFLASILPDILMSPSVNSIISLSIIAFITSLRLSTLLSSS